MNLVSTTTLLIKTSRPIGWFMLLAFFFLGVINSGSSFGQLQTIQAILLTFPMCLLVFGINDVYDYKTDKINPRKKTLEGIKLIPKHHGLVKKTSLVFAAILAVSSVATLNVSNMLGMFLLLFFGYFYSAPPLRFKDRPIIDSFSNGVLIFSCFLLGFSFGGSIYEIPIKWYFVSLAVMGIHAFATTMDYEFDKKVRKNTFSVAFGRRAAAIFATLTFILLIIFGSLSRVTEILILINAMLFMAFAIYPHTKLSKIFFKIFIISLVIIVANITIEYVS